MSRLGMTTWELPDGYGRVKPDILAVGQDVLGPKAGGANGECRHAEKLETENVV